MIQSQTLLFSTFPQVTQMHKLSPYSPGAGTLQYTELARSIEYSQVVWGSAKGVLCPWEVGLDGGNSDGGKLGELRQIVMHESEAGVYCRALCHIY